MRRKITRGGKAAHSCRSGKRRLRDREEAKVALSSIRSAGDEREVTPCRVYKCPECHGWHLTHRPTWSEAS